MKVWMIIPFKLIPPNQRDLEQAKHSDKFPAEPIEVDTQDEL